jgi:Holliday junction resolvasome RuvABC endonuclease subunit
LPAIQTILGAYVEIKDGNAVAGLAVIDGDKVLNTREVLAAEKDPRQLKELHNATCELIQKFEPEWVSVVHHFDPPRGSIPILAHHGEGAILAAAGQFDVKVASITFQQFMASALANRKTAWDKVKWHIEQVGFKGPDNAVTRAVSAAVALRIRMK